jgi:hypothetical protein
MSLRVFMRAGKRDPSKLYSVSGGCEIVPKFQPDSNPTGTALEFWNCISYWNKIPTLFQPNSSAGIEKSLMNQGLTRFIPKFQFFSRTTDFGVFSRSFPSNAECIILLNKQYIAQYLSN